MALFEEAKIKEFTAKLATAKEGDTVKDADEINYYNRKYAEKNKGIVIPGSFYKVRAQGGAV